MKVNAIFKVGATAVYLDTVLVCDHERSVA
jgi:hypothetical protein